MADTLSVMTATPFPAAFALLNDEQNPAADAALVEVLPQLEPRAQATALGMLLKRGHAPSLEGVVGGFHKFDGTLPELILHYAGDLSVGVRLAIGSTVFEHRANAVEIIVQSDNAQLAYLLAEALRSRCSRTRELASEALYRMTARLLEGYEAGGGTERRQRLDEFRARADYLAEALRVVVRRWENHFQPKALVAALWMGDRVEPALLKKLQEPRTRIAHMLNELLESASDPRLAGFVLRALAIPELRQAAAHAISRAHDTDFLRAVFNECWLLGDARIEHGCRWIRSAAWRHEALGLLFELDESVVGGAVRFLTAIGGQQDQQNDLARALMGSSREEVRRAVVWQLVADRSDAAGDLLTVVAARPGDAVARMAARELGRRRVSEDGGSKAAAAQRKAASPESDLFEQCWERFDAICSEEPSRAADAIREDFPNIIPVLRNKLASCEVLGRARALRLASALGVVDELEESVQRLAHDPEPVVRSLAVRMLARIPGLTTQRLLRAAVNDPDERVQANAIEALDELDTDDRISFTAPKLASSNSRVRANAIKSLLRVELSQAGETLLDMLDDSSADHRLSALWVIERLRLQAVLHRLRKLALEDPNRRVRQRARRVFDNMSPRQIAESRLVNSAQIEPLAQSAGESS